MEHKKIIKALEDNIAVFNSILSTNDSTFQNFKINPEKWNLLEIICHLYDEEREDFRARLKHILENPDKPLTQIDPVSWVQSREYAKQDFTDKLDAFLDEREESISWLKSLKTPKWENAYQHPKIGPMSANLILANWLEHDYLHLRQILNVKHEYLKMISGQKLDFAGNW